jgi:hypothetical protein
MSEMKDFNLPTKREMPLEKWLCFSSGKDTILDLVDFCLDNFISFRVSALNETDYTFYIVDSMEKYEKSFDALQEILES